ncbi:hypothetical protein V8G54_009283 [Vigna mungo]|uniref:Uncharacterized protein n=1 Tax=Vigna mungo TaxID=3915 RepID=A0AAQ3NTP1_VIGMU
MKNVLTVLHAPDLLLLGELRQTEHAYARVFSCLSEQDHRQELPDDWRRNLIVLVSAAAEVVAERTAEVVTDVTAECWIWRKWEKPKRLKKKNTRFLMRPIISDREMKGVEKYNSAQHKGFRKKSEDCDDDTIHLYDLSTTSSIGSLNQHSASVTVLSFYAPSNFSFPHNLISVDDVGSLTIFYADDLVHLRAPAREFFIMLPVLRLGGVTFREDSEDF